MDSLGNIKKIYLTNQSYAYKKIKIIKMCNFYYSWDCRPHTVTSTTFRPSSGDIYWKFYLISETNKCACLNLMGVGNKFLFKKKKENQY